MFEIGTYREKTIRNLINTKKNNLVEDRLHSS